MAWKKVVSTVAIVASFCLIANAQPKWQKFSYFFNTKGLEDQIGTTEIDDGAATEIQNIVFDIGGALKKRYGYLTTPFEDAQKVATGTSVSVSGVKFFEKESGSKYLFVIANNDAKATAMKKDYSGSNLEGGAWDNIDYGGLPSLYLDSYHPDFAIASNSVVFTSGVATDKPFVWDGTDPRVTPFTSDADCPTATIVEYHKNHLFLAGGDDYPSRVNFSTLDNIVSFEVLDFFDVATGDGSKVRALLSAYDSLYIWKDGSIWRLSGWERDTFRLEKMIDGVGTTSAQSPVVTDTGIYFTSGQFDSYHYDGAYTVTPISTKISRTIDGLHQKQADDCIGLAYSSYKPSNDDYYVAVANGASSTNDRTLLFDTTFKAWTKFKGINAMSWTVGEDDNGRRIMFFGDYDGYVHRYPSTSYYDGNVSTGAIEAVYQTKWFRYPEVGLGDKYWRLLKVYALSEDGVYLNADCKSDYEASGTVVQINLEGSQAKWDVAIWDVDLWGGDTVIVGREEIGKGKEMFQIKFYNNLVDEGFTLLGFSNFLEPSDRI